MPSTRIAPRISVAGEVPAPIAGGVQRLRDELQVPGDFPPEVVEAARQAAASGPRDANTADGAPTGADARVDLTAIEFVTIDPPGSMDLDQAMFLERIGAPDGGEGYRVWYAIADVAAWVQPGGVIDAETHRRGQTFYAPDASIPLHPRELSEGAASLLADGNRRPALVWQIELDADARTTHASVQRGWVISRARLDYAGVQQQLDAGTASPVLQLLREVGQKLQALEAARGGVSLNLPEQEVSAENGTWVVHNRVPLPVEGWNAEISLLTGMAAARIMLDAHVGIVRTLPPADAGSLERLRRIAQSLGIDWPASMQYPEFVRSLDVTRPAHLAMLTKCTLLFRGAAYTVIDATTDPATVQHAALAATYAHATAPLRRLVDRYVGEVCVHVCAGTPVPGWVLDALPGLPAEMADSDHRASRFDRGIIDLVEALELTGREGQQFTGTIVDADDKAAKGTLSIAEPAVLAPVSGTGLTMGSEVTATLASVDVQQGHVQFTV